VKKINSFQDFSLLDSNTIYIWTDGSAVIERMENGLAYGHGGIGIYMKYGEYEKKIKIGYKNTRTGRMEIKAVIMALNSITDKTKNIIVYSDSQYVVKSINIFMQNWIYNGWIGIKNVDLWKLFLQIYSQFDKTKISFVWTKGHTDKDDWISIGNSIVDELASYKTQEFYLESDLTFEIENPLIQEYKDICNAGFSGTLEDYKEYKISYGKERIKKQFDEIF
jgi:ribonuclease HI